MSCYKKTENVSTKSLPTFIRTKTLHDNSKTAIESGRIIIHAHGTHHYFHKTHKTGVSLSTSQIYRLRFLRICNEVLNLFECLAVEKLPLVAALSSTLRLLYLGSAPISGSTLSELQLFSSKQRAIMLLFTGY